MRRAGLACEVLSGDAEPEVARMAEAAGVDSWRARVEPAGKLGRLGEHAARGRKVLMVGDGLNDAPALAAAHASLSPVTAADISQATADVVFQGDALAPVLETILVARESQRMAFQNFAIALGYNAVFVPLAVVGLVTPLLAAIAMSASSVAVTANAVRLRAKRLQLAPKRIPS
jgi:Cu2+-exporting ATPase